MPHFSISLTAFLKDLADTNIVYNLKRKCWMLIDFEMSEHYPRPWTEPLRVLPSSAEREPEVGLGVPYDPYLSEAYGAGVILWRAYNFSHLEVFTFLRRANSVY